jgi:hypothetical protein
MAMSELQIEDFITRLRERARTDREMAAASGAGLVHPQAWHEGRVSAFEEVEHLINELRLGSA